MARQLFTEHGYAQATLEDVAERAGVTKGALYHHFANKRELFQAVFEQLEQELVEKTVVAAVGGGDDVLEGIRLGVRAFLEAALDPAAGRIVLIEGPSVLGFQTWREIDARYGFDVVKKSLAAAMDAGAIVRRPVDPLAHLFLAAISEAALQIAQADDRERAMDEMTSALFMLLDSMRVGGRG